MRTPAIILVSTCIGVLVGTSMAYIDLSETSSNITALPELGDSAPTPREAAAGAGSGPRVQVDEPRHDFGSMQRGTSKSHGFVVKNVGNAPLTLRVGQTTCKCTLGEVTHDAVPPGGSTTVMLEWKALADNGPFRQSATLITNDPLASSIELSIEGQVTEATNVSPSEFLFDKISVGETKSAEVILMAMLQDELTVSEAKIADDPSSGLFDVKVEPVERDKLPNPLAKQGVKITVTARPRLPVGRLHQWLSLHTNLDEAAQIDIPLVGRVVGDISVHGIAWNEEAGVLVLGKVKSSEGKRQRLNVVVRGANAADVKLELQSSDPAELKVAIGAPRVLSDVLVHYPVDVEVPAGTRPMVRLGTAQGEEGRIVLNTTHPNIKELVLGVRFAVER